MAERKDMFPSDNGGLIERKPPERKHGTAIAKRVSTKAEETFGQKFKRVFLADNLEDLGPYIVNNLIGPAVRNMIIDFWEALLLGDRGGYDSRYRKSSGGRTNYSRISTAGGIGFDRDRERRRLREREKEDYSDERKQLDISDLVFRTKVEAEEIISRLEDYIENYDCAPVGYLYELIEESGPYTAEYYGWSNLRGARIERVKNGYQLKLPRPVRLD